MLRINKPHNAKDYYARADVGDYYARERGGNFVAEWGGRAAEMLGLEGAARMEEFHALCDNRNPATGEQLTARNDADRRQLYDLTFSVPKSVAAMRGLFNDGRITEEILASVDDVMRMIEAEHLKTRVRRDGRNEDRLTGNAVWLPFYHTASRPVDGIVDMGDHVHVGLLSLTKDPVEEQWKAIQPEEFWKAAPFWEAVWHANLARRMERLGFETERSGIAFEITGVDRSVIDEFSRRSGEIDAEAERRGITDSREKSRLGALTREKKIDELTPAEQQQQWLDRLSTEQREALNALWRQSREREGVAAPERSQEVLAWTLDHLLERESAVAEDRLLEAALREGVGTVTLDGLREAMAGRKDVIRAKVDGRMLVSTREVIDEERAVLDYATGMQGHFAPLNPGGAIQDERLSREQRKAVAHIWSNRNPIMLFRGKAGTGKTTTATEAVRGIREAGHDVVMLAPTAEASRGVLASEGFAGATTVAEFLLSEKLQEKARGNVVWIDEAGLMPFRDMTKLVGLARELDARIVLSGDRRQHRAVARGEPLAVLEDVARLPVAELKTIRRQKGEYREAVDRLAAGDVERGFDALEKLGAIRDMPEGDRHAPMIDAWMEALRDNKSVLALSPTRREGALVTEKLRERLKAEGKLAGDEHTVGQLRPLHLTEAERRDPKRLVGTTAVFVRCAGKYRPGQRVGVTEDNAALLAKNAEAFAAYEQASLPLAAGDTIRVTANGYSRPDATAKRGHRLHNGSLYRVKDVGEDGITLNNGWVLPKDFGHISHGYVLTSYAGQGKTFDRVLVSAPAQALGAVNTRQLYVDASRGRERFTVFTDDREALRAASLRERRTPHALELVGPEPQPGLKERLIAHIRHMRRVWENRNMMERQHHGRTPQIAR